MKRYCLFLSYLVGLWLLTACGGGGGSPTVDTANHLSVAAPATTTAGTAFGVTVTALDAANHIVAGYSGTVHFSSTDGLAVLPADSTLTNGTGTFSANLKSAGGQTITASDTVTASISGTSLAIAVNALANHFSVSAPSKVRVGTAFKFTVTALDAANDVVANYSGTIHFSSTDGQAALPADSTLINGTGAFSATLRTDGSQTLTATDTVTVSIRGASNSILAYLNCLTQGQECPPQGPTCCPGLVCAAASDRAFCEPDAAVDTGAMLPRRRQMRLTSLSSIPVVTLSAALASSNPLVAQDKKNLGSGNDTLATQSQSSAFDGGGSFDLNYWSLLFQVVDDQNGAPSVDPLSLQPPAILSNDNPAASPTGDYHTYKACWKVAHPGRLDPPGTAIKCYSGAATFDMGDGSLAGNPNGNPDVTFSGLQCPLTGTQQFLWVDQLSAYWNSVRFYNANGQLIEGYRHEAYAGRIYNYTTGKSIPAWMDYVSTYQEVPGPDGTANNLQWGYYGNDFSARAGRAPVLTPQWGVITYTPGFASVIAKLGPHPFDDYLNTGATAGLAPICSAME